MRSDIVGKRIVRCVPHVESCAHVSDSQTIKIKSKCINFHGGRWCVATVRCHLLFRGYNSNSRRCPLHGHSPGANPGTSTTEQNLSSSKTTMSIHIMCKKEAL